MPKFADIKMMTKARYQIDIPWSYLEKWIEDHKNEDNLDLNPDFQRAHVWTERQQIKYVEYIIQGGISGKDLYFNHPGWFTHWDGTMVIVDGKQRLQSARLFLANKIPAFGHLYNEYEDSLRMIKNGFVININNLENKSEVLQWYLNLNEGGTDHTQAELDKVKKILKDGY